MYYVKKQFDVYLKIYRKSNCNIVQIIMSGFCVVAMGAWASGGVLLDLHHVFHLGQSE